jgi:glycosyltransferase involved in cell wall biosynthesis
VKILRQALLSGDLLLLFALSIRVGQLILRYFIERQALGRSPKPYLGLLRASLWRVSALRRTLRELAPDAVLSFLGATNIMTIASAKGLPTRIVISERNDPSRQELGEPWQSLRPIIYPVADIVTANSHGAIEEMQRYCRTTKLNFVPNPVILPADANRRRMNAVLFLARLVHQKGPDVLVNGFARFVENNPGWSLQIAGDGPMERDLVELVREHGIEASVIFHGLLKDPSDLLARSRVFVLPSRFEGTPNSLLEAMAARLACVVTDASPGPLRLVEHEVSGLVVKTDDADDLAAALHRLARDAPLRRKLARAAWERTSCHRLESVAQAWERVLFST